LNPGVGEIVSKLIKCWGSPVSDDRHPLGHAHAIAGHHQLPGTPAHVLSGVEAMPSLLPSLPLKTTLSHFFFLVFHLEQSFCRLHRHRSKREPVSHRH
jgi:hypothetical protein